MTPKSFTADVSAATLAVTTLGALGRGRRVNLEPPLKAGDPLDGHIVTGHVDGVGEVVAVEPAGRSTRLVDRGAGCALRATSRRKARSPSTA